ncbi:MAG: hypothetical protein Q7J54_00050, partial [Candidatus Woesearchaeota archaeon]|nr:hypothetical protein [Candidatus Woesearchaeota archaeon]
MKLEMNIAKKHLYYLAAFVVFVFIIGIAMAQTAVNNPGHPAEQIDEGTIANTLTVSGGNVGIGTTNPDASLVVSGDSVIGLYQTTGTNQRRYQLFSTSSGNGDAGGGKFAIRDAGVAGSAGYRFVINENGNVGIGTTSPIGLLDLSGQTSSDIVFSDKQWWGGVSNPRGRIYSAIDSDQWAGSRLTLQSVVGSGSSYSFIDTMSLKNGNVGIGTANPRGKLQIGDMSGTLGLSTYPGDIILDKDPGGSNGIGGIEFRSSVSAGGAGWKITATGNYLGHKLLFAPRSAGATWETEVLTLTQ